MKPGTCLGLLALALAFPAGADSGAQSVSVPIKVLERNTSGYKGIGVLVTFASPDHPGTPPVTKVLMLDTGSDGIRIFSSELPRGLARRNGRRFKVSYSGGHYFRGEQARAFVGFGAAATASPIVIDLVDKVGCTRQKPDCTAKEGSSFMTAKGFAGIMGTGLRANRKDLNVYSPLAQLPGNLGAGYIISANGAGEGVLTFGLTRENSRGFTRIKLHRFADPRSFANGRPSWEDRRVKVCVTIGEGGVKNHCAPSLFDSGDCRSSISGLRLRKNLLDGGHTLRPGVDLHAGIAPGLSWDIVTTKTQVRVPKEAFGGNSQVFGLDVFLDFDVLYDLDHGEIGFRPRSG